ncbi:MAG: ABC transporter ATP-binding protein [Armatimonadetes bacterium]|nr:ABC transporter ATP-binding protein [Armatimonadota bacterium]
MQSAIQVSDLVVNYRQKNGQQVEAVKGLSFYVGAGEIVGFLGPNGAGKSSTLKALMGFVKLAAGSCQVFGIESWTEEARKRIGYLPEVAMYYPFLNPKETLTLYGELQGLGGSRLKSEVDHLLEVVGLKDATHKLNKNLSKGMLQRVGIAQSLLGNPELLILDEVTSGLDPVGRKELRTLLKSKQQNGTTLFFSSHELAEVDLLCDRLLFIHKGKLIQEKRISDLHGELSKYEIVFTSKTTINLDGAAILNHIDGSLIANFESKPAFLAGIETINQKGGQILDLTSTPGSLEDYFIQQVEAA